MDMFLGVGLQIRSGWNGVGEKISGETACDSALSPRARVLTEAWTLCGDGHSCTFSGVSDAMRSPLNRSTVRCTERFVSR